MKKTMIFVLVLSHLFMMSCGYSAKVSMKGSRTAVKEGQLIKVTLQNGNSIEFKLKSVTEDMVYGDGVEIPFKNIRKIEKVHRAGAAEQIGMVLGLIAFGALVTLVGIGVAIENSGGLGWQ